MDVVIAEQAAACCNVTVEFVHLSDTAEAVNKELDKIMPSLPPDIQFFPWMDQADMIQRVIRQTGKNAVVGGILAVFFILLFLGNWRPTLTIALAS